MLQSYDDFMAILSLFFVKWSLQKAHIKISTFVWLLTLF